jgi:hypothetical protein
MINSTYYKINEEIFFLTIVSEKKAKAKNILNPSISLRVLNTFQEYLDRFHLLSDREYSEFKQSEGDVRKNLINCYKNETASSKNVKGKIFSTQPNTLKDLCPYCMLDRPRTLDHYIPKDEFPEYAMFVNNLVPCCYNCNNIKDELWRNNTERQFIHFYNDKIFDNQFLYSKLFFNAVGVAPVIRHSLRQPEGMSVNNYKIASAHFRNLGLLEAYDDRVNSTLSAEIETIATYINKGIDEQSIVDVLQGRFKRLSASHGLNYFNAVLYQTLINHLPQIRAIFM